MDIISISIVGLVLCLIGIVVWINSRFDYIESSLWRLQQSQLKQTGAIQTPDDLTNGVSDVTDTSDVSDLKQDITNLKTSFEFETHKIEYELSEAEQTINQLKTDNTDLKHQVKTAFMIAVLGVIMSAVVLIANFI